MMAYAESCFDCSCRDRLFPESIVRNIVYQVLQGLVFMHKHGESTECMSDMNKNNSSCMHGNNNLVWHLRTACVSATKQSCQLAAAGFGVVLQCATCSAPQPIDSFVWLPKRMRFWDVELAYFCMLFLSQQYGMTEYLSDMNNKNKEKKLHADLDMICSTSLLYWNKKLWTYRVSMCWWFMSSRTNWVVFLPVHYERWM